ncbi:formylglycine-generating enzyme family protein [Candidatus Magnetomonas plexicatena]|uniref:formylglycine-generating enzyme family protein n=1 Tax=Candidatus Magnetomonas plexicatena TaxID=2552947 RepID=UPI001C74C6B5|nr:formylglycine-generating enzyme family protein [Nitrospirales bacterium LBB_01]
MRLIVCLSIIVFVMSGCVYHTAGTGADIDVSVVRNYIDPVTGMKFIYVVGGCYQMGDTFGDGQDNEKPVHEVCLDSFYIGKYEVTQRQWAKIMGNNPSTFPLGTDDIPVEHVTWYNAQDFINKLNELTDGKYRLPSEAQWEYACRSGGKNEKYSGGDSASEYAWLAAYTGVRTQLTGQKSPNGLGIYDMSGNVWEWVLDVYDKDAYSWHGYRNPVYTGAGKEHVIRGGAWNVSAQQARCTVRYTDAPANKGYNIGFRLLRTN